LRKPAYTCQTLSAKECNGISARAAICSTVLSGQAAKPLSGAPKARGLTAKARTDRSWMLPRNKFHVPFFQGLLAEMEYAAKGVDGALTRIDEALALATETGECWSDAFLHRIRGEILLKSDPANKGPAEEAFLTAIAIAKHQKAKSFELQAALPLAKLYQSTGRPADAHDVLAPALEGFAPTPEFPEIAEAQALLPAPRS
jgi:predicted ATPase